MPKAYYTWNYITLDKIALSVSPDHTCRRVTVRLRSCVRLCRKRSTRSSTSERRRQAASTLQPSPGSGWTAACTSVFCDDNSIFKQSEPSICPQFASNYWRCQTTTTVRQRERNMSLSEPKSGSQIFNRWVAYAIRRSGFVLPITHAINCICTWPTRRGITKIGIPKFELIGTAVWYHYESQSGIYFYCYSNRHLRCLRQSYVTYITWVLVAGYGISVMKYQWVLSAESKIQHDVLFSFVYVTWSEFSTFVLMHYLNVECGGIELHALLVLIYNGASSRLDIVKHLLQNSL